MTPLTSTTGAGASAYTSDADGNTLSGGGRTMAWDSQNRLVSCILNGSTSAFKYGADGLRRQKTANGAATDYAYDGTMLVREGRAVGGSLTPSTVTATYFLGAQGPCYRRDDTQSELDSQGHRVTKASWYVFDGLGSVVGEVDPLGNLTSSPKYDVYGAVRSNGGTASSKQGFVGSLGHVSDDTGLVYMRARYYDPSTGRFASEDTSGCGANWFIYCGNNPVNSVDSTGKSGDSMNNNPFLALIGHSAYTVGIIAAGMAGACMWGFKYVEAGLIAASVAFVFLSLSYICSDATAELPTLLKISAGGTVIAFTLSAAKNLTEMIAWYKSSKDAQESTPNAAAHIAVGCTITYGIECYAALQACDTAFEEGK